MKSLLNTFIIFILFKIIKSNLLYCEYPRHIWIDYEYPINDELIYNNNINISILLYYERSFYYMFKYYNKKDITLIKKSNIYPIPMGNLSILLNEKLYNYIFPILHYNNNNNKEINNKYLYNLTFSFCSNYTIPINGCKLLFNEIKAILYWHPYYSLFLSNKDNIKNRFSPFISNNNNNNNMNCIWNINRIKNKRLKICISINKLNVINNHTKIIYCEYLNDFKMIFNIKDLEFGTYKALTWILSEDKLFITTKKKIQFHYIPYCLANLIIISPLSSELISLNDFQMIFDLQLNNKNKLNILSILPIIYKLCILIKQNNNTLYTTYWNITDNTIFPIKRFIHINSTINGKIHLNAYIINTMNHKIIKNICFHKANVWIEVVSKEKSRNYLLKSSNVDLHIVTAADGNYFENKRLRNLIGSIHYWEPFVNITIYDLGFNDKQKKIIQNWKNVQIKTFPFHTLPSHFKKLRETYSFKPWALQERLIYNKYVIWLDANAEIRRSLDELRYILYKKGVFYTIQRPLFPNNRFHSFKVIQSLGCHVPIHSRLQIPAGLQGYQQNSTAHKKILNKVVQCAMNKDCIAPNGTNRTNHRQDQTVLNAIICSFNLSNDYIQKNKKWWLSSHIDDQNEILQPLQDETKWNDMIIYTRREHPVKPYLKYIQLKDK